MAANLTDDQITEITNEVNDIISNNSKSTDELYTTIGNAFSYSANVKLTPTSTTQMMSISENIIYLPVSKSVQLLSGSSATSIDAAKESGQTFWQRLKQNVKNDICTDTTIKNFFTGTGN